MVLHSARPLVTMPSYPRLLKSQAETAITDPHFDFIATYHAVSDLRRLAKRNPDILDDQTVFSLKALLQSDHFINARQAYFLFREAAKGLTDIILIPESNGLGSLALASLHELLTTTSGSAHRGVAEAIGGLPVNISGPKVSMGSHFSAVRLSWDRLLAKNHLSVAGTPKLIGRSLVARTTVNDRLLVLKLAKTSDTPASLAKEICWMQALRKENFSARHRFDIPQPLLPDGNRLCRPTHLPIRIPGGIDRHPQGWAIAFLAHRDYFVYPNSDRVDSELALEMLERNAFLLGRLSANGIIHDAPIPLFHNRTQRLRREDQGRYQWFRSGRLDQWLSSCQFPNLGKTGVRDFEHLETFNGHGRLLYRHIGTHIFSLLLIAGSHFRSKDKSRLGLNEKRQPVDTRDLFDRKLLKRMVQAVFAGYYEGFAQADAIPPVPLQLDRIVDRMIEEMGIDQYMTELFRRTDQSGLSDGEFISFLKSKGISEEKIRRLEAEKKDILITSGPHLGNFNRQISLPELIECTATMSAVCIAGRYMATCRP